MEVWFLKKASDCCWSSKYSKTKVLQVIRIIEIGVRLMALVSLSVDSKWLLVVITASLGFVSACSRVTDYSLLPVLVDKTKLNNGNIWLFYQ